MAKCYGYTSPGEPVFECYAIVSKKGDYCDGCIRRRLASENKELLELVKTYKDMPFPCHDYMTEEQWERICYFCSRKK